ncbi:MAG: hypothetical protein M3N32_07940 [Actinomycetota bacterium]|nr:hypothetical protein [Actinomycetota bacterium]
MTVTVTCKYPDVSPVTGYGKHCRCDRCKTGWREYRQLRKPRRCLRCHAHGYEQIVIDHVDLCLRCLTPDERITVLAATYTGRYGAVGV